MRKTKIYLSIAALALAAFLVFSSFEESTTQPVVPLSGGSSNGFYGDVTYTCFRCPGSGDCWRDGDKVRLLEYPSGDYTGISRPIIRTGSRSGGYSGLVPPYGPEYWYLQGMGEVCNSGYYLVFWPGMTQSIRQDIDMSYNRSQEAPEP